MTTRSRLAAIVLLLTFAALPAAAQEFGPGILPADTSFYIYSRGTAHAETTYPNNPMIQSWNSPEFAQFRQQGIDYLVRHGNWKVNGRPVKFTSADAEQIFSFLKGPMMIGYAGSIDFGALAQPNAPSAKQLLGTGGAFAIIDATGKTAQFDFLLKFVEANLPKEITRTRSEFSGVSIEQFAGPNNTSFATRVGNYFVWSNQQKVVQDLVSRLSSHAAPANSLAQNAGYQHCQAKPDPDSISEMYFRFPDFTKLPIPATPQFDTAAAMSALHLDSLKGFCANFAITPQGEHSRMVVLGDTAAGGIFNLAGTNRPHFDSLSLAPSSAFSYTAYALDINATYKLVRAVALAGLPAQQAAMVQMAEGMAGAQLGMSLADALALVSGEFAMIQLDPTAATPVPLFAVSISNSEKVSALIHKLGGDSIVEDSHENGVTIFKSKSAPPPADPHSKASDAPPPNYVALTPHFLLYGGDKESLLKAARMDSAGTTGGPSLADSPEIRDIRAALPRELLGLNIIDYTHHDWAADMTKALGDSEKSDTAKLSPEDIQFFETMKKFGATTIGKMLLRRSVSGWWKDADGIHYEGFSQ